MACGGADAPTEQVSPEQLAELTALAERYEDQLADSLLEDSAAQELGSRLFAAHCSGCHGDGGRGTWGVTDLINGSYDYGRSIDSIRVTIRDGRKSVMPGFGDQYNEFGVGQLVSHVAGLESQGNSSSKESDGDEAFRESCAECHGDSGQGQLEVGAPDLTDEYWQHSGSMTNLRSIITNGIESACPAQLGALSVEEIELLTAWVFQSGGN